MILRLLDFRFQPGSTGVLLLIHGMGQDVPTHVTRFYGRALDPSVPGGNLVQSRSVRNFQPKCSEQAENPGSDRALFRKKVPPLHNPKSHYVKDFQLNDHTKR